MDKKPYYITTAITYTSGKPHIGNTYEIILTDAIARFKRDQGYDVRFQTGTDEHGQKIEEKAAAAGKTPKQFVDGVADQIRSIWDMMNISYDKFIRTTDADHEKQVQKIFRKLYEQGDIYKGTYEGLYCTPFEAFWTPSQLKDGKCPDCGREVQPAKEEAYFFRMSKYADRLLQYYEEHPAFILPLSRKNEMVNNFLKPGLQDLCVSRTSFTWGIPVGFDPKHVVYVWLDALTNYITGLGYDADGDSDALFAKYWPGGRARHRQGHHPFPHHLLAHLPDGAGPAAAQTGVRPPVAADGRQQDEQVARQRHLRGRAGAGVRRGRRAATSCSARCPSTTTGTSPGSASTTASTPTSQHLRQPRLAHVGDGAPVLRRRAARRGRGGADGRGAEGGGRLPLRQGHRPDDEFKVSDALGEIFSFLRRCNKYIDETAPWLLAKDPERRTRLATVLYNLAESVVIASSLLRPFIPDAAEKALRTFSSARRARTPTSAPSACSRPARRRGSRPPLPPPKLSGGGGAVTPPCTPSTPPSPSPLPPTGPLPPPSPSPPRAEGKGHAAPAYPAAISIEDFAKVRMQVGEVVASERVKKSEKLLKNTVKIGSETRTVVSGIAKFYSPRRDVGKKVVVVTT